MQSTTMVAVPVRAGAGCARDPKAGPRLPGSAAGGGQPGLSRVALNAMVPVFRVA